MAYIRLSPGNLAEIEKHTAEIRAGKTPLRYGRTPAQDLRKQLYQAQLALHCWRKSPVGKRGYTYVPDCAGELLRDCAAYRRVLHALGEFTHYENPTHNY